MVTSSLGFHPDRHAGQDRRARGLRRSERALGRAARSDRAGAGDFRILDNLNVYFSRHLASRFPKIDLAAAWQHVLEVVAVNLVRHWVKETKCDAVVLSGGVTANVKMNQRIHELDEVERTFVYPNMGDGGCGTGLAMLWSWPGGARTIRDAYFGPEFSKAEIRAEIEKAGLAFAEPADLVEEVAKRIHAGEVIGRFGGRMEYGPRALGQPLDPLPREGAGREPVAEPAPGPHGVHAVRAGDALGGAGQVLREHRRCGAHGGVHDDDLRLHGVDAEDVSGGGARRRTARPQLVKREINPSTTTSSRRTSSCRAFPA
jgi:hypothetical protein